MVLVVINLMNKKTNQDNETSDLLVDFRVLLARAETTDYQFVCIVHAWKMVTVM